MRISHACAIEARAALLSGLLFTNQALGHRPVGKCIFSNTINYVTGNCIKNFVIGYCARTGAYFNTWRDREERVFTSIEAVYDEVCLSSGVCC